MLRKAWQGYRIARSKGEKEEEILYASVIQKASKDLGITVNSFPHLGMSAYGEYKDHAKYLKGERLDY